ncbi:hypothetical protein QR680_006197 [Steinernema hermaphroditum]|uniref:Uncharacterized protein n=1 Tax=Steinernema hermaphroditum TaxID=289476 RepID=A0AA39LX05_9BILA|nr:hypothetical protein QR680_006197 [Steinernema hermaphroditum]
MVFADFFINIVNFLGRIQAYFSFAAIPVNVLIIILSVWKVPNCLVKTYTLNISIATLVAVTYSTSYFSIVYFDPKWLKPMNISLGHLPFVVDNFLSYLAINVYYFQSTVTMTLAYINYKRLFFFQNTVIQSVTHACQAQMGRIRQSRWNVYRSVLLHCFVPNLFFWLSIPDSLCSAAMSLTATSVEGLSNFDLFCVHIYAVTQYMNPPRLFMISSTVLLAFEEYRRAILELLKTPFKCCLHMNQDKNSSVSTEVTSEVSSSAE